MASESAGSFRIGDLAIFDETHLREVISSVPGAVPPKVAGCALAYSGSDGRVALDDLATHIEHALAPAARAEFVSARQQALTVEDCMSARRTILDRLFWELTYWKTPDEYERLTAGEQVHLGALAFAHVDGGIVLDAGAGAGRVTMPLARRARTVFAMDPAPAMLRLLDGKLASAHIHNVELLRGVFRRVPLADNSVDAVVACSAFGAEDACGGQRGLDEFVRVTRPGGRIVIIWPSNPAWFLDHGFQYTSLPGHLTITFPSMLDAWTSATRFYGMPALRYLEATGRPELPFEVLGVKAPRDLCWLTVHK